MSTKKVNWNNKNELEIIIKNSTSYNQVLKTLGVKTIGSNVKTLKKYIEKYNLNTSHFTYKKEESKIDNVPFNIITGNEPKFKMEGILKDVTKGLRVELDWNAEFIDYLKQLGFHGGSEEELVGSFLNEMYKPLGNRMKN